MPKEITLIIKALAAFLFLLLSLPSGYNRVTVTRVIPEETNGDPEISIGNYDRKIFAGVFGKGMRELRDILQVTHGSFRKIGNVGYGKYYYN